MRCKYCGEELVTSKKEQDVLYCVNCKKKFRVKPTVSTEARRAKVRRDESEEAKVRRATARRDEGEEAKVRRAKARRGAAEQEKSEAQRIKSRKSKSGIKSGKNIGKNISKNLKNIFSGKLKIVLIVLLGIVLLGGIVFAFKFVKNKNSVSSLYDSDNSDTLKISFNEEQRVGDYTIKVAQVDPLNTKDGEAGVRVVLQWYNGGDDDISAEEAIGIDAYQGTIKLDPAVPESEKNNDEEDWETVVKKDEAGTVWKEFKLENGDNIDFAVFDYTEGTVATVTYGYGNILKQIEKANAK